MNDDYFDDIMKIFEARDERDEVSTLLDDDLFELPDRQNWKKENNYASAKPPSGFVVERSMHDEKYFNLIGGDTVRTTYTPSDLKRFKAIESRKKRLEILENIGYGLFEKLGSIVSNNSGGLIIGLLVAGYCAACTMEARSWDLDTEVSQETPKAKYESIESTNTYINKTTFVQKEDGSVTNITESDTYEETSSVPNITETEVYKEFEEYARSNNLVMNKENFDDFCIDYFSQNTSGRGR